MESDVCVFVYGVCAFAVGYTVNDCNMSGVYIDRRISRRTELVEWSRNGTIKIIKGEGETNKSCKKREPKEIINLKRNGRTFLSHST